MSLVKIFTPSQMLSTYSTNKGNKERRLSILKIIKDKVNYNLFLHFRATLVAHGSCQDRGRIRPTAGCLHHSHSNVGACATYTTAHCSVGSLDLLSEARDRTDPESSWKLVIFVSTVLQWELQLQLFKIQIVHYKI